MNAEETAKDERITYAIMENHYVDDYLDSTDDPDEAFQIVFKAYRTMKKVGFELVNWSTNSKCFILGYLIYLRATTESCPEYVVPLKFGMLRKEPNRLEQPVPGTCSF